MLIDTNEFGFRAPDRAFDPLILGEYRGAEVPVQREAELLELSRSSLYYAPAAAL